MAFVKMIPHSPFLFFSHPRPKRLLARENGVSLDVTKEEKKETENDMIKWIELETKFKIHFIRGH